MTGAVSFPRSPIDEILREHAAAGRLVTAGLTILNRAGMGPVCRIWVPHQIAEATDDNLEQHLTNAQWVAVRQVDIAREAGNEKIDKFDADRMLRSLGRDTHKQMDAGYSMIIVTVGLYTGTQSASDQLKKFDDALQERIGSMVGVLWNDKVSAALSQILTLHGWLKGVQSDRLLPDVGLDLDGMKLVETDTSEKPNAKRRKIKVALLRRFLDAVVQLPARHLHSDRVTTGLQLPVFGSDNDRIFTPEGEYLRAGFEDVMNTVFGLFDMVPLTGSLATPISTMRHIRSYAQERRRHLAKG